MSRVDVVISLNNVQVWPDLCAGLREQYRILRPGRENAGVGSRELVARGVAALTEAVIDRGFTGTATCTWEPPGTGAVTAVAAAIPSPSGCL